MLNTQLLKKGIKWMIIEGHFLQNKIPFKIKSALNRFQVSLTNLDTNVEINQLMC